MDEWVLPEINRQLCDRCGRCVESCPTNAVELSEDGPVIVRPQDCDYCALCDAICPQEAITCTYEIIWDQGQ